MRHGVATFRRLRYLLPLLLIPGAMAFAVAGQPGNAQQEDQRPAGDWTHPDSSLKALSGLGGDVLARYEVRAVAEAVFAFYRDKMVAAFPPEMITPAIRDGLVWGKPNNVGIGYAQRDKTLNLQFSSAGVPTQVGILGFSDGKETITVTITPGSAGQASHLFIARHRLPLGN